MLLFAPILCCAGFLVGFVALFQFFTVLASGETNPHLAGLGRELGRFSMAIMDFLTYNTDRAPFPFAPWPAETVSPDADSAPPRGAARPRSDAASRSARTRRRKKTSSRTSSKRSTRKRSASRAGGERPAPKSSEPAPERPEPDETKGDDPS